MRNAYCTLCKVTALLLFLHFAACAQDVILGGTIVTPDRVVQQGWLAIKDGKIDSILDKSPTSTTAPIIETGGIIFPGFVDLHNHPMYNVFGRWHPPNKFKNRYEWRDLQTYKDALGTPAGNLQRRDDHDRTFCDIDEYAEVLALIGGTTSISGISARRGFEHPVPDCLTGLVRNLDWASGFYGTAIGQERVENVLGVAPRDMKESDAKRLRDEISQNKIDLLLVHVGEGSTQDMESGLELLTLMGRDLAGEHTAIIHGTGLAPEDFRRMRERGVSLIWSPRSNIELYGGTTNVVAAFREGVTVALAPDWSPTGSTNMLAEIGYASRLSQTQMLDFVSNRQLFEMATAIPARIAKIDDKVGSLQPQMYADLFVLRGDSAHPFDALAHSKPQDVELVLVAGKPLYGHESLMKPFKVPLEKIEVCGTSMFLNSMALLAGPFADVERRLKDDLKGNVLGLAPHAECKP
jgi:hypothetical protein